MSIPDNPNLLRVDAMGAPGVGHKKQVASTWDGGPLSSRSTK